MNLKTARNLPALCLLLALVVSPAHAQNPASQGAPDNTRMNMRDRDPSEPTADNGSNQLSDRQIMQGIRKAVVSDKSLSTYAHNVKIISSNGKVTLKGPVQSSDESQNIEAKARQVAGDGNVVNQLSVKSDTSTSTH